MNPTMSRDIKTVVIMACLITVEGVNEVSLANSRLLFQVLANNVILRVDGQNGWEARRQLCLRYKCTSCQSALGTLETSHSKRVANLQTSNPNLDALRNSSMTTRDHPAAIADDVNIATLVTDWPPTLREHVEVTLNTLNTLVEVSNLVRTTPLSMRYEEAA